MLDIASMKSRQPLLVVLALCYGWQVFAQDTVTTAEITKYVYSFDPTTNGWNGKGAEVFD